MGEVIIREITPNDNVEVARVVRKVLLEMGVPKERSAYADASLNDMYTAYDVPRAEYFVAEKEGEILGCAGIAQLENYEGNVCELQKMYVLPKARGLGLGTKLISTCLAKAKVFGFDQCYLETMPYMEAAQKLYNKNGFEYLEEPMGDTGHYACPVWMIKKL
ncbi:GNAT family N-acetyltransferase [Flagellimonas flava]|uniref:Putative acetyltransferase n=1 Tax=Flagellimonas flava TaxID=570519 RepID=A0A1M5I8Z8_9FLAO|nr:GNAT family N-acetyltransferase [Allomuricauda flava]SHG24711.1 putative acetyltransferase [Allomuricauda flava]